MYHRLLDHHFASRSAGSVAPRAGISEGGEGCGDNSVREAVADDGVDGGRRGGGGVCVLCFADLPSFKLRSKQNLETFQEASSRLPGTLTVSCYPTRSNSHTKAVSTGKNFIPHMLFLLSKRFEVHTSKVLYPQFLYEIPFYVRGGKQANKE